jgi:hypothetical protein
MGGISCREVDSTIVDLFFLFSSHRYLYTRVSSGSNKAHVNIFKYTRGEKRQDTGLRCGYN